MQLGIQTITVKRLQGVGHDWFAQSGFKDHEGDTAYSHAKRLIRYISDPSTVRVRTLEQFGCAPSTEVIRKLRDNWIALVKERAEHRALAEEDAPDDAAILVLALAEPEEDPAPAPVAPTLDPVVHTPRREMLTAIEVIDTVAEVCDISHGELIGSCRERKYVAARELCAAVLRARGNSYPQVGRMMNGRDHTTILHNVRQFFDRGLRNPQTAAAWQALAPEHARDVRKLEELDRLIWLVKQ